MKIAKVKWQYERDGVFYGNCSCCGEVVRREAKGIDEECRECGSELDWSADEAEQEADWRDFEDWEDEQNI